jgi:hypothetical protein
MEKEVKGLVEEFKPKAQKRRIFHYQTFTQHILYLMMSF